MIYLILKIILSVILSFIYLLNYKQIRNKLLINFLKHLKWILIYIKNRIKLIFYYMKKNIITIQISSTAKYSNITQIIHSFTES